jgi:hypothetical protein
MAGNKKRTHRPESARAIERRQKALELRIAGARYRQIGQQLGVSHVQAFRDIEAALDELATQQTEQAGRLRQIELERLEKATLGLWPKIRTGDDKAVRAMVAVMDRRARLLGLDAPTRTEHTGKDGQPIETKVTFGNRYRPQEST